MKPRSSLGKVVRKDKEAGRQGNGKPQGDDSSGKGIPRQAFPAQAGSGHRPKQALPLLVGERLHHTVFGLQGPGLCDCLQIAGFSCRKTREFTLGSLPLNRRCPRRGVMEVERPVLLMGSPVLRACHAVWLGSLAQPARRLPDWPPLPSGPLVGSSAGPGRSTSLQSAFLVCSTEKPSSPDQTPLCS